jgi:hypothetical protein
MSPLQQFSHIMYIFGRDFYLAAKPNFGLVFIAIACLSILFILHKLYSDSFKEIIRTLIHELTEASQRRRSPSAMNFIFGVLLLLVVGFIILGAEVSSFIRDFFLREAYDPNRTNANLVITLLLVFFLGTYFILCASFCSRYET